MPVIYKIISNKSDQVYVGSTTDYWRRCRDHVRKLTQGKHHSYKLQKHWNVYKPTLMFEILDECSLEELPELEYFYIMYENAVEDGFNCTYITKR